MIESIAKATLDSQQAPTMLGEPVVLRDVHKSFGTQHVLDGINLTVVRGDTLAVLGREAVPERALC